MTWYHPLFQRGKEDLLKGIVRSTNKGKKGSQNLQEMQTEINSLKEKVVTMQLDYETKITILEQKQADRIARLEEQLQTLLSHSRQQQQPAPYSTLDNHQQSFTNNIETRNIHQNPQTPNLNYTHNNKKPRVTQPVHQDAKNLDAKTSPLLLLHDTSLLEGPTDRQVSFIRGVFPSKDRAVQTTMKNCDGVAAESALDQASLNKIPSLLTSQTDGFERGISFMSGLTNITFSSD